MRKQVVFAIFGILLAVAVACSRDEEATSTPTQEPSTILSATETPEPGLTPEPTATPRSSTLATPEPTAIPGSASATPGPTATPGSTSATATPGPTATPRPATATATPRPASTPAPIPLIFRGLYAELEAKLDKFDAKIESEWDGRPYENLSFFAELLTANGNSGPTLLGPNSILGNILFLNRLQELGVQGVEVTVNYPLLTSDFPRSAEYARFYNRIAREVRKRNMTLFVKVEAMFVDPEISNAGVDYTGITFEILADGKRQQMETVLKEMRPDFMTISMEPDTVAFNTGLIELRDPGRTTRDGQPTARRPR